MLFNSENCGATHRLTGTSEYVAWANMKQRCFNPNNPDYPDYGGRGIVVCQRWIDSFEAFYADMGPRPSDSHSIDRENNDGNYEPGNCRWATVLEQNNNQGKTVYYDLPEGRLSESQVTAKYGISSQTFRARLSKGMSVLEAVTTPVRPPRMFEHNGQTKSLSEWSAETGVPYKTLHNRLVGLGWTFENAIKK